MMTIRLPHILCGSYCISSLTWAGCVAYLSRWHAKASVRDKQEYDSHVFFLYPFCKGVAGYNLVIMTQKQVKTMLRELIEKGTYSIFEVSEISSFDGSVSNREVAMVWNDSMGKILRVQLSNASMMPGEIRFFYSDGIHLPYYRSVFFKEENDDSNEYLPLPSDVLTYVKEHDILSIQGIRDELKEKIVDLFNGDNWQVMDPFIK